MTTEEVQHSQREVRVALAGEYDIARAGELRHALLDIDRRGPVVIVDLSDVTFIDSAGLRALLEVRQTLTAEGCSLKLDAIPNCVSVLLDITGTGHLFDVSSETESS